MILLISDAAQANDYKTKIGPPRTPHPKPCTATAVPTGAAPAASRRAAAYFACGAGRGAEPLLKKGATLGLSHGFLLGHLVR